MPEDRRLIGALTVEDNILMPVWASRLERGVERLSISSAHARSRRYVQATRLGVERRPTKMVALARAVMSGTKFLLLDEPFEGLSPAMGRNLARTIQELQRETWPC